MARVIWELEHSSQRSAAWKAWNVLLISDTCYEAATNHLPCFLYVSFFKDPVEAKGFGENKTVGKRGRATFSCPVDGVPEPNITWYRGSEVSGTPIFIGEKLEASDTGCYTCVASNSLGLPVNITQCLTVGKPFFDY